MSINTTTSSWREMLYRLRRQVRQFIYPVKPSTHLGMGARPYAGGTAFRVWAPHAHRVFVSGSFNNWSRERHPLANEGNGYWSADIDDAIVGDEYRYLIHNGTQRLVRTDPHARDVTEGHGNGVISEISGQLRGDPPAWMPKWNELVIYELHVGTFDEGFIMRRGASSRV